MRDLTEPLENVLAHPNGTYLLARALLHYPAAKFPSCRFRGQRRALQVSRL